MPFLMEDPFGPEKSLPYSLRASEGILQGEGALFLEGPTKPPCSPCDKQHLCPLLTLQRVEAISDQAQHKLH